MGTNVPDDRQLEVLMWFRTRLPQWAEDPARFGLTEERMAELEAAFNEAQAAFTAAYEARGYARAATLTSQSALTRLDGIGRSAVNTIKAHLLPLEDPDLWADARLSPPRRRGTLPLPIPPADLTFSILSTGALRLAWKVTQPRGVRGVVYSVLRGLNGERPSVIRVVGEKFFIDDTLPIGFTRAVYKVQPRRGTHEGTSSRSIEVTPGSLVPRTSVPRAAPQAA